MTEMAETFLRYVQPHWRRLHQVAGRYAAHGGDAHDLVQETLLRAWKAFAPTEERSYRRAWLFVIMRNVALDWQRTASRRIDLVLVPDSELTELAPADLCEPFSAFPSMGEAEFRELLDERIATAFDKLEDAHREVIFLSVAGELTYREIAEVLDCPVGTVMSRMARARRALRTSLADFAGSFETKRRNKERSHDMR